MSITQAGIKDAARIAAVVSQSNRDVAEQFGLTRQNNPKHPSFYTPEWVRADLDRGEVYFLFREGKVDQGCVAFEQADAETAYLNRLSVLLPFRHQGIGAALVRHVIEYSRIRRINVISIGIIAHHDLLKRWYTGLGFAEVETRQFDHLPFDVSYMHYRLD